MKNSSTIYEYTISEKEAEFCDYPNSLDPRLKNAMVRSGKSRLYTHQLEAYNLISQGKDVCLQTPTASGKTIAAMLPVINHIIKNPGSKAIIVVPTKALGSNMSQKIAELLERLDVDPKIAVATYDGDTPSNKKSWALKNASIIITNPEMLNIGFLPNHRKSCIGHFLDNTSFVFVDEIHEWSGVPGSNISMLFARFSRICTLHNVTPVFICASATIANPVELASKLFHRSFVLVNEDGAPHGSKTYSLVVPLQTTGGAPITTHRVTTKICADLLMNHEKFIAFSGSKTNTEVTAAEVREIVNRHPTASTALTQKIRAYRAGYSPKDRLEMEQNFSSGKILGLTATVALELGVDLPGVDFLVQDGLPRTNSSFWQQSGRAGRGTTPSQCYVILGDSPRENYVKSNPDWLFNAEVENAVINPGNRNVQRQHIRAAAFEASLTDEDRKYFSDMESIVEELVEKDELARTDNGYKWTGDGFPASNISIRGINQIQYMLVDKDTGEVLHECDEDEAYRMLYPGAILRCKYESYLIEKLDCETHTAIGSQVTYNYYTEAIINKGLEINDRIRSKTYPKSGAEVGSGGVVFTSATVAFKCIEYHNKQTLSQQALDRPLVRTLETKGVWISIQSSMISDITKSPDVSQYASAVAYCIALSAAMATQADFRKDLAYVVIPNSGTNDISLVIYDLAPGGMGFSEKAYEIIDDIIRITIRTLKKCHCDDGCPNCVGFSGLSKKLILKILRRITGFRA